MKALLKPFLIVLLLAYFGLLVYANAPLIEDWIAGNESVLAGFLKPENFEHHLWLLLPVAFLGGLIASLSPCILALLPVILSYIGALDGDRRQAVTGAMMFVLGVVLVLSAFGLFASFANAVIVDYKGWVHIGVGLVSVLLGAGMMGLFKIRVPQGVSELKKGAAPFVVGTSFALVTSPCASPILLALMLIAGTSGSLLLSVATMVSYALGYTFVLMLCSVLAGVLKHITRLRQYGQTVSRIGGGILILAGLYYGVSGLLWFREM